MYCPMACIEVNSQGSHACEIGDGPAAMALCPRGDSSRLLHRLHSSGPPPELARKRSRGIFRIAQPVKPMGMFHVH